MKLHFPPRLAWLALLLACLSAASLPAAAFSLFQPKGTLYLSSEPGGAKIFVNGKLSGNTPTQVGKELALYIGEGDYTIEAVIDGNPPLKASQTVHLTAESIQPVHFELAKPAAVAVSLAPAGISGKPTSPVLQNKTDSVLKTESVFVIEMVKIPGGTFDMGCGPNNGRCETDENPRHQVTVPAFAMAKTEITQGQWKAVMGSAPPELRFKDCGDNCPVERVSWNDVQEFIKTLNQKTGGHYRLPSESEWEYACRSGQDTLYCGGNDADAVAWYDGNSGSKTHPVGGKQRNALGLYDMSGNVWEWVQDCRHDSYQGAPTDGSVWDGGTICANSRAVRGGSWSSTRQDVRSADRTGGDPAYRYGYIGFRLAQD